ncbi:MAG: hypothetical protein OXB89_04385 [Anaerolineaceae bacterium]|nr:hypothetical protein [Anaerolineaceae bacterium]
MVANRSADTGCQQVSGAGIGVAALVEGGARGGRRLERGHGGREGVLRGDGRQHPVSGRGGHGG